MELGTREDFRVSLSFTFYGCFKFPDLGGSGLVPLSTVLHPLTFRLPIQHKLFSFSSFSFRSDPVVTFRFVVADFVRGFDPVVEGNL